jgi:hypothetical protein
VKVITAYPKDGVNIEIALDYSGGIIAISTLY